MKENFEPNGAGENGRADDISVPQDEIFPTDNEQRDGERRMANGHPYDDTATPGDDAASPADTQGRMAKGHPYDDTATPGGDGTTAQSRNAPHQSAARPASPQGEASPDTTPDSTDNPDTTPDAAPPADADASAQPKKPKKGRVRRFLTRLAVILVFLILFFVGLCVMLYPAVSNYINDKNASRVIDSYDESIKALAPTDYSDYFEAARIYNAQLAASGTTMADAFSSGEDDADKTDEYWSLLDPSGTGVMGYIVIDKVKIKLPLYHGTDEAVLQVGAGHLMGSSLPVGGESTHTVVSAHTGLPSAELFTDVDQLESGDVFELHILGTVLTYKVDQILTVLPHELEALNIEIGKDYATLITCTPYGINSHRLLIRGERIDNIEDAAVSSAEPTQPEAAPAQPAPEQTGKFQQIKQEAFRIFANVFEKLATWFVVAAEWVMDLIGIDYRN